MDKDRPPKDFSDWIGLREVPDWAKARWIGAGVGVLIALILILALAAAVTLLLRVFDPSSGASGNLGTGALVVAILGAPFVIWNIWIKSRALGFQKEGHITDRINTAVEHLGAEKTVKRRDRDDDGTLRLDKDGKAVTIEETVPNIEVRIGGLLSLERVAQDSTAYDKGRDHVRVMEILCAYVRENAPARTAKDSARKQWEELLQLSKEAQLPVDKNGSTELDDPAFLEAAKSIDVLKYWARHLLPPREDIAQALQIIGRRTAEQRMAEARWGARAAPDATWVFDTPCPALPDQPGSTRSKDDLRQFRSRLDEWKRLLGEYAGYRLDLRNTNLQGADLSEFVLSGARLTGARMEGANLWKSRMEGASLQQAQLEGASLWQVQLQGASLRQARMEGAMLMQARLEGTDLTQARMDGTVFAMARMERADLSMARMEGATLRGARMEGATLRRARMDGADLANAWLDKSTGLTGATLRDAKVSNVDWSSVPLSDDQIACMFGDASVVLPGGVTPGHPNWPAHWPVWKLFDSFFDDSPTFDTEYQRWLADPTAYVPPPPPDPAP